MGFRDTDLLALAADLAPTPIRSGGWNALRAPIAAAADRQWKLALQDIGEDEPYGAKGGAGSRPALLWRLARTGQVFAVENALNDLFDRTRRRIRLHDASNGAGDTDKARWGYEWPRGTTAVYPEPEPQYGQCAEEPKRASFANAAPNAETAHADFWDESRAIEEQGERGTVIITIPQDLEREGERIRLTARGYCNPATPVKISIKT